MSCFSDNLRLSAHLFEKTLSASMSYSSSRVFILVRSTVDMRTQSGENTSNTT